jgi:hypothetical protein
MQPADNQFTVLVAVATAAGFSRKKFTKEVPKFIQRFRSQWVHYVFTV